MDHLPSLQNSSPLPIPCLCPEGYDGGEWKTYPGRHGCGADRLLAGELDGLSPVTIASILQAWLYFGLLFEVFYPIFGDKFDQMDFIDRTNPGGPLITTKELPKYIIKWADQEVGASNQRIEKEFTRIRLSLVLVRKFARKYCEATLEEHISAPNVHPLHPAISLSIKLLADTLQHAGYSILRPGFNLDWGHSPMLVDRMREAGWCPRAISSLLKGQQIQNLWYASTLGHAWPNIDHAIRNCNEYECKWEQVDETYETQHRVDCDGCPLIHVNEKEVLRTLDNGGIPLLNYCVNDEGSYLRVVDSRSLPESFEYVALSHVWADGLGNRKHNALYRCQIKFIQSLVDQVRGPGMPNKPHFWWCDTLSIPLGEDYQDQRKEAIRSMGKLYSSASCVIVLDSSLMRVSKDRPATELHIRLKLSPWMRRLWTLQEGIFAKKAYIQFSDGTRSIRDIDTAIVEEENTNQRHLYRRYKFLSRTSLSPFTSNLSQDTCLRFLEFWKTLMYRSTSHQRDESTCLATLLALDPGPVLNIVASRLDQRMAKVLELAGDLPLKMVFQPPPRLAIPGFTWAPTSLLNIFRQTWANPFLTVEGRGTIGPLGEGLTFQRSGMELDIKGASSLLTLMKSIFTAQTVPSAPLAWSIDCFYKIEMEHILSNEKIVERPIIISNQNINNPPPVALAILANKREQQTENHPLEVDFITVLNLRLLDEVRFSTDIGPTNIPVRILPSDHTWRLY